MPFGKFLLNYLNRAFAIQKGVNSSGMWIINHPA